MEETLKERAEGDSVQALRQKNMKELADNNAQKEEFEHLHEGALRDVDMFRQTLNKCEEVVDFIDQKRSGTGQRVRQLEEEIQRLAGASSDSLSVYGAQMSRFVKRLEQEHKNGRFTQLPRGPVGRYIQVPDKKWRGIVENTCSSILTSFIVNADKDRLYLQRLLSTEFSSMKKFSIITTKFSSHVYDVSHGKTNGGQHAHVLMDLMRVSDPVVMNALIDQVRIETILICEDQDMAIHFTQEEYNKPPHLYKVVCMNPLSEFFPSPNYRSYSMAERQCRFIQVNTEELRNQLISNLKIEQQKMFKIETERTLSIQKKNETQKTLQERDRQLTNFRQKLQAIKAKINEIQNYEYPAEDECNYLETDLQETKEKIKEIDATYDEVKQRFDAAKGNLAKEEQSLAELRRKRQKVEEEIIKVQATIDKERDQMYQIASNTNAAKSQKEALTQEAMKAQAEYKVVQDKHKEASAAAEKLGPRVTNKVTRQDLTRKIAKVEQQIKQLDSKTETLGELEQLIGVKKAEVSKNEQLINVLGSTLKLLSETRMRRYEYVKKLKVFLAIQVQYKFRQVLRVRNFHGSIQFDYKNQLLDLKVVPRGKDGVTNTKALSGGERSYSTVAFLIALWSCIDHPFYFLDEYDVFTDQVNRFVMTKLLIHEAEKKGDQFGFLTPQDMSSINATNKITIHRFADPERAAIPE